MTSSRQWRWLGPWAGAWVLAVGCVPSQLTINVRAAANTNQGRPLYMVVRLVDGKAYLAQTYDEVVTRVVTPDDSVLYTEVVYPGMERKVTVKAPQPQPVAVSFLFTAPDGAWQTLLDAQMPGTVDIDLEGSRIREGVLGPGAAPKPQEEEEQEDKGEEAPAEGQAAK